LAALTEGKIEILIAESDREPLAWL
jgi:hypothetical protein